MDSLLRYAYIEQRCNACGGSYRVTLYEAHAEHQVQRTWRSARHCEVCSTPDSPLVTRIPPELVDNLHAAWERILEVAREAGLELKVGAQDGSVEEGGLAHRA